MRRGDLSEGRALVFGLVCLSLSITLHSPAHGALPSGPALPAGGLTAFRRILARRRPTSTDTAVSVPVLSGTIVSTRRVVSSAPEARCFAPASGSRWASARSSSRWPLCC